MFVGSVCTQPPYNDKNPTSAFFVILLNVFLFLKSSHLSLWRHTDGGPSHDCWLTVAFQHRLRWCLTSDPPWVSCHQLLHRQSKCRQEWLLSDCGVLLLDVIMNIAVDMYSHHLSDWRGLLWFWRECALDIPKSMFARIIHDPASSTEEVSTSFFKWIFANRLF